MTDLQKAILIAAQNWRNMHDGSKEEYRKSFLQMRYREVDGDLIDAVDALRRSKFPRIKPRTKKVTKKTKKRK